MAQKLRLAHSKEGKRINEKGPQLFAEKLTHDQALALCEKGHAAWFIWCEDSQHPNPAERPAPAAPVVQPSDKKKPGPEKLVNEEPAAE